MAQKFMVTIEQGKCKHYDVSHYYYYRDDHRDEYEIIEYSTSGLPLYTEFFDSEQEAQDYFDGLNLEDFVIPRPTEKLNKYGRTEAFLVKELNEVEVDVETEEEPRKIIGYKGIEIIETLKAKNRFYKEEIDN